MAFVGGRFEAADLLLGGVKFAGEILLGKARFLAKGGKLQRHVPGFAGLFKTLGEGRVSQLCFQISIKFALFHFPNLSRQSRIRSSAVSRSRAGMAWLLLRIP